MAVEGGMKLRTHPEWNEKMELEVVLSLSIQRKNVSTIIWKNDMSKWMGEIMNDEMGREVKQIIISNLCVNAYLWQQWWCLGGHVHPFGSPSC